MGCGVWGAGYAVWGVGCWLLIGACGREMEGLCLCDGASEVQILEHTSGEIVCSESKFASPAIHVS